MPQKPAPSAALILEVRALICGVADVRLGAADRPGPGWDLDNLLAEAHGGKEDYLAVVRAARQVAAAAEITARMAARRAHWHGADFAEIGAAEGITRQAVRQRMERATARRTVRFVGGPRDGTTGVAFGTEREIRRGEIAGPWEGRYGEYNERFPAVTSAYRAKYGSPDVFEFHHYEDSENGKVIAQWDRRPRVHELARYWRTDSMTVLAEARKLSPEIKTPASRVDLALLEQLRTALAKRLGGRRLSSALPEVEEGRDTSGR